MQIETVIQCYSLKRDEVGQEIGEPVVVAHKDGTAALLHLWQAMDNPPTRDGYKYHIRFPDGETVPFDAAYTRIFGEKPVYRDNKPAKYPRLLLCASQGGSREQSRPDKKTNETDT